MIEIVNHPLLSIRHRLHGDIGPLIFISSHRDPFRVDGTHDAYLGARERLLLTFEDLDDASAEAPTKDHVESALRFADGRNDLTVSCTAGISRSAAIAFLIACKRWGLPKAFGVLNREIHRPNRLVLRLGSELLQCGNLEAAIDRWQDGD